MADEIVERVPWADITEPQERPVVAQTAEQAEDHRALNLFEMDIQRWLMASRAAINSGDAFQPIPVFERPSLAS